MIRDRDPRENGLYCTSCSSRYDLQDPVWRCRCGGQLTINHRYTMSVEDVRGRPWNFWRYRESLPLTLTVPPVSFGESLTPISRIHAGGREILLKLDYLFITGSFKDRGAAVLISKTRELGIQNVVADSSGNAGTAVAAYCARAGVACEIHVPETTSAEKILQITQYGAHLVRVPGDREAAARSARERAQTTYYASHYMNPFFFQGIKTAAFEISEQLGWAVPDHLVIPVGNGSLLIGLAMGFQELYDLGLITRVPRIHGVQSDRCDPVARRFHGRPPLPPGCCITTLAEGIAVPEPPQTETLCRLIRRFQGGFWTVTETEILHAAQYAASHGFFVELTAAAALAAVIRESAWFGSGETVMTILTGHGLKSVSKLNRAIQSAGPGDSGSGCPGPR